jgi:hypothetical protein
MVLLSVIVTDRLWVGWPRNRGSFTAGTKAFSLLRKRPDQLRCPHYSMGTGRGGFPKGWIDQSITLPIHFLVVLRLRKCGSTVQSLTCPMRGKQGQVSLVFWYFKRCRPVHSYGYLTLRRRTTYIYVALWGSLRRSEQLFPKDGGRTLHRTQVTITRTHGIRS